MQPFASVTKNSLVTILGVVEVYGPDDFSRDPNLWEVCKIVIFEPGDFCTFPHHRIAQASASARPGGYPYVITIRWNHQASLSEEESTKTAVSYFSAWRWHQVVLDRCHLSGVMINTKNYQTTINLRVAACESQEPLWASRRSWQEEPCMTLAGFLVGCRRRATKNCCHPFLGLSLKRPKNSSITINW